MDRREVQTAYIDESGYTGRDLLSVEQPYMALSAIFITDKEAGRLRSEYFPQSQAPELKHSVLAKRPRYHRALLSLHRECLSAHRAVSFIVDKKYMAILKFLNDCIEPVWYTYGLDFYQDGAHLAVASLIYTTTLTFWGEGKLERLLTLYQDACKARTETSLDALCEHVRSLEGLELSEFLSPIAEKHPAFLAEFSGPASSTNIAPILLSGLVSRLEQFADGPYEIAHDTSPAMREYHPVFEALRDTEGPGYRISAECQLSFPLKLTTVREADSKAEIGLQLADLLAGGVISGARVLAGKEESNVYNSAVFDQYSDKNIIFMLPSTDFEGTLRSFGGNQISEAIGDLARRLAKSRRRARDT